MELMLFLSAEKNLVSELELVIFHFPTLKKAVNLLINIKQGLCDNEYCPP